MKYIQFSSVAQSCLTLCNPVDCSTPGLPVHHQYPEPAQTQGHRWMVMPSNHLILCCPLLLLPSISPNIRVSSNESVLLIRWAKYWHFSFSTRPSNEHPGLKMIPTIALADTCIPSSPSSSSFLCCGQSLQSCLTL